MWPISHGTPCSNSTNSLWLPCQQSGELKFSSPYTRILRGYKAVGNRANLWSQCGFPPTICHRERTGMNSRETLPNWRQVQRFHMGSRQPGLCALFGPEFNLFRENDSQELWDRVFSKGIISILSRTGLFGLRRITADTAWSPGLCSMTLVFLVAGLWEVECSGGSGHIQQTSDERMRSRAAGPRRRRGQEPESDGSGQPCRSTKLSRPRHLSQI